MQKNERNPERQVSLSKLHFSEDARCEMNIMLTIQTSAPLFSGCIATIQLGSVDTCIIRPKLSWIKKQGVFDIYICVCYYYSNKRVRHIEMLASLTFSRVETKFFASLEWRRDMIPTNVSLDRPWLLNMSSTCLIRWGLRSQWQFWLQFRICRSSNRWRILQKISEVQQLQYNQKKLLVIQKTHTSTQIKIISVR